MKQEQELQKRKKPERKQKLLKQHPRCLEFCSVSEAFTPKECKLICPGRFKKDSLPEA